MRSSMPSRRASPLERSAYVALLRGINVGGKNKLPMADLSAMFTAVGCSAVQTYIQSGNVVFEAPAAVAGGAAALVAQAIADRFGYRIPVVLRTAAELAAVALENPLLAKGADPSVLHVVFLAGAPAASRVAALDPNRSPPDELLVRGREIYLACPNGIARTRITNAYLDATLATTSTLRNWRTVLELARLSAARGG
jgi:uncharacterized protein (DUF1697 family)